MTRILLCALSFFFAISGTCAREQWTPKRANQWQDAHPWLVGCNFIPSSAINQLEMWQGDTFDLPTIERELGWAKKLGFNSLRVFLHHMLWEQDRDGFLKRMETFLQAADKHKIGVMFVLLDGVWDPFPKLGKQRAPKPHVHNSGWVQSPGLDILKDPKRHRELEGYITGVIQHFRSDRRIHAWDVFNEPDNRNPDSYIQHEPKDKAKLSLALLEKVFAWARTADPEQPVTAGVWHGAWGDPDKMPPINRYMLEQSDVISFHAYSRIDDVKKRVEDLRRYQRPILCTEYMARPMGSTFDPLLGYFKDNRVAAYNWGFVDGKSQTIYPWDSWKKPYTAEPDVWFHDIFRKDGTAYRPGEVEYIQRITGVRKEEKNAQPESATTETASYVRAVGSEFVQECTFAIVRRNDGWTITSRTERGKTKMEVEARYDPNDQLTGAHATLFGENAKTSARVEVKDGKAAVQLSGDKSFVFDAPKGTIVTSAPDWTDVFLLCRRYDRAGPGKQEFPALWVHPTQKPIRLTFSIDRHGVDFVETDGKKVELNRFVIRIRGNSGYMAWANAEGRMIRLLALPFQGEKSGLWLQGHEQSAAGLRPLR